MSRDRRLAEWLREWEIDQALGEAPKELAHLGADVNAVPEDSRPEPGQIRLWLRAPAAAPVYVALLDLRPAEGMLCAPFSRFSQPALPGELWLRDEAPLRVLNVWNVIELVELAACSWFVDDLTTTEREDALLLRGVETELASVPPRLVERVGAELRSPLDPRHAYMAQEAARVSPEASAELLTYPEASPALARAAETDAAYADAIYRIASTDFRLRLRPDEAGRWVAGVEAGAGEPCHDYDGYLLQDTRGAEYGPIRGAQCSELPGGEFIGMRDPANAGVTIRLTRLL